MTLLRKGRDPRPVVDTCSVCGALNEFEIEIGDVKPKFNCGHCDRQVSFNLSYFYAEEKTSDDDAEDAWHDTSESELKRESS